MRKIVYVSAQCKASLDALVKGSLNDTHNVYGFDGMSVDAAAERIIQIFLMEREEQSAEQRGWKK